MNLELNISETIINLHRPYYAKALFDDIDDSIKSEYAPSFLTVIERCAVGSNVECSYNSDLILADYHCYCHRHPYSLSYCQHQTVEFVGKKSTLASSLLRLGKLTLIPVSRIRLRCMLGDVGDA